MQFKKINGWKPTFLGAGAGQNGPATQYWLGGKNVNPNMSGHLCISEESGERVSKFNLWCQLDSLNVFKHTVPTGTKSQIVHTSNELIKMVLRGIENTKNGTGFGLYSNFKFIFSKIAKGLKV